MKYLLYKKNVKNWWVFQKETTEVFSTRFLSVLPSEMALVKLHYLRLELTATPKLFRCDYPKTSSLSRTFSWSKSLMRKAQSPARAHPNIYWKLSHSWKVTSICRWKQLQHFRERVTLAPLENISKILSPESRIWPNYIAPLVAKARRSHYLDLWLLGIRKRTYRGKTTRVPFFGQWGDEKCNRRAQSTIVKRTIPDRKAWAHAKTSPRSSTRHRVRMPTRLTKQL